MSLLALLASAATDGGGGTDPDPPPGPPTVPASLLHSTDHAVLDWAQSEDRVLASQLAGYDSLREQDDVIYDPGAADPNRRWALYFSAMVGTSSRIWVSHSPDGVEWTNPVFCFFGQDPSITQTWEPNPVAYRDGSGRLVMFCENNGTDAIDAHVSTDGVTWTLEQAGAIPRGTGWDSGLTGSPNARHDGTRFIVGYEGINYDPWLEQFSVAWGATPSTLTKSPAGPVIDPSTVPGLGTSIVSDAIWLDPAGGRVFLGAHDGRVGSAGVGTMWRMTTTKTDPTTWVAGDFAMVGGMAEVERRGDFTLDVYHGRVVTTTAGGVSLVDLPLVLPV